MPRRKMISEEKRRAIQDAIVAGMRLMDIREQLSTSAMTISKIKREMGLPMRKRKTAPEAATPAPTVMHHREIPPHSYLERVRELEKLREQRLRRGFAATTEDITSEDVQPAPAQATIMHHREIPRSLGMATAPTTVANPYSPQEYFLAIADGLRSRDAENAALRDEVTGLRSMAARLEADNLKLVSDLNQCKLQMANWSGPATLPSMSLGNGG